MTPARAGFLLYWLHLRKIYEGIVFAIGKYGLAVPDDAWRDFRLGVLDVLGWADLTAAADIRYRATRQRTRLPQGEHTHLESVAEVNPWYAEHATVSYPLLEKRAEWTATVEREYLSKREHAIAQMLKPEGFQADFVPLWRLDRMRRDAVGEIAATSEQIEMANPEIGDAFTHCYYFSRDDMRVRPTHRAMHGFVASRSWSHWPICRTPCSWNCRCFLRFVARFEAIGKGWLSKSGRELMHVRWPNTLAELNFNEGRFPEWKDPRYWAWPGTSIAKVA